MTTPILGSTGTAELGGGHRKSFRSGTGPQDSPINGGSGLCAGLPPPPPPTGLGGPGVPLGPPGHPGTLGPMSLPPPPLPAGVPMHPSPTVQLHNRAQHSTNNHQHHHHHHHHQRGDLGDDDNSSAAGESRGNHGQFGCKNPNKLFGVSPSDIDKYSRVVFPVCFVCFNLMYWIIYLHISAQMTEDLVLAN